MRIGNLGDENLAATHHVQAAFYKAGSVLEPDPEARHARIRNRKLAKLGALLEERDDAPARSDDVAIAYHGKARPSLSGESDCRNKQLLRAELRRAIQVDRIDSLVGRQRDDLLTF